MNIHFPFLISILSFITLPIFLSSQVPSEAETDPTFSQHYKKGEAYFNNKDFEKAITSFEKAIKIKPDFAATYRRLGLVYEVLETFDKAAHYYDECIQLFPSISRVLYFQSGEMHLKSGNYDLAYKRLKAFEDYLSLPANSFIDGELELDTEAYLATLLDRYIQDSQFGLTANNYKDIEINNLGAAINSEADDCFPYLSNDESWMFYTRLGERKSIDENLIYSANKDGMWGDGKPLGEVINSKVNEGMGKATRDERLMFFPACNRADALGICDIFMAAMEDGKILDTQKLNGEANSDKWDSQPTINCDGQVLYFVSNREGGYGGTDIWMSYKQEDGSWGKAINLGEAVNTPKDEEAPFISDDGVTLYFASNGHAGYGDQDIFYTRKRTDGSWNQPKNLGEPINSPNRELSFFINARGNKGYLASDRPGGYGGLDIYTFPLPDIKDFEEIAYVKGTVKDAVSQQGIATTVSIDGKGVYQTDDEGRFFICYPTLSKLPIYIDEPEYYPYRKRMSLTEWESSGFVVLDILLQPLSDATPLADVVKTVNVPTVVEDIEVKAKTVKYEEPELKQLYSTSDVYFYFDQYQLTQEARYNLDQMVEDIDPNLLALIIVEGYADQIGTDDYNKKLSEKRAEEVAKYFKSKGLQKLKIMYSGYGEVSSSLTHSKNRRVDVAVYYKQ